ncbi:MAG TPA: alpha/beta hydrolase [Bordetella sp.]|nr:alpha/beta hydrolase [Bordetella sp.]
MNTLIDAGTAGLNHVLHAGTAPDIALLLIHPLGADLAFWDDCVRHWAPTISCVACDLRSAGQSPRSAGPAYIAQHVADLEALRAQLGIRKVVPIGCAIGSMIAAAYAAAHADHVDAVVLSNPTLRTSAKAAEALRARAAAVLAGGLAAILPAAVDTPFLNQPMDERRDRYFQRFASQDAQAYAASIMGIVDADVSADVAALRCPALVIAGAHDTLLPTEQALQVHEALADSEFQQFSDAAHFVPYQQPAEFAQKVLHFLARTGNLH